MHMLFFPYDFCQHEIKHSNPNSNINENLRTSRTLTYLKPDTYSEPSQRFKTELFAKIVKNYNHFSESVPS